MHFGNHCHHTNDHPSVSWNKVHPKLLNGTFVAPCIRKKCMNLHFIICKSFKQTLLLNYCKMILTTIFTALHCKTRKLFTCIYFARIPRIVHGVCKHFIYPQWCHDVCDVFLFTVYECICLACDMIKGNESDVADIGK